MYGMYNPQYSVDRINEQINSLERLKGQVSQQPAAINQTFQLAPGNQNGIKYVNNIEDVQKELVFYDSPFFNNDLTQMWLKNTKGEIRIFNIQEIIPKDEKDLIIESLQTQIMELKKGMVINEQSNDTNVNESIENDKSGKSRSNSKNDK